jgi:hypothetical protein
MPPLISGCFVEIYACVYYLLNFIRWPTEYLPKDARQVLR